MYLRTWKYNDGSTYSEVWDSILNGEWPYTEETKQVIFIIDTPNPLYS